MKNDADGIRSQEYLVRHDKGSGKNLRSIEDAMEDVSAPVFIELTHKKVKSFLTNR